MKSRLILFCLLLFLVLVCVEPLIGREIWVTDQTSGGNGTSAAPYDSIQFAVNMAQPGDVVILKRGTYRQGFNSVRSGSPTSPITIRAESKWAASLKPHGRVVNINHSYIVVDGIIMDGDFVLDDLLKIQDNGHYAIIRNCEIRNTMKDCIDMDSPTGVLIEGCLIHHSLNPEGGRTDAHGIVAGAVRDLTIRNTRVHTFSGDAFQLDPSRRPPGWDNVLVEGCTFWLTTKAGGGFPSGRAPGENAIDTKVWPECPFTPKLVIRNTTATGYRNGIIQNMSAFNLKEKIDATLDGVTVGDSQHAFRIRGENLPDTPGGAKVTVMNAVVYECETGFRIEDSPPEAKIFNVTFGKKMGKLFDMVESEKMTPSVQNILVLGKEEVRIPANGVLNVTDSAFVNSGSHDYHLAAKSPAIDKGISVLAVRSDRDGNIRVGAPDMGAYEWTDIVLRERKSVSAEEFKPPTGVAAKIKAGKEEGKFGIALSWMDNSANEDGFEIERSEDAGKTWTKVGTTEPDITTGGDGKIKSGTDYLYRVRAFNKESFSPYSEAVPIKTEAATSIPPPPLNASITSDKRTAEITWLDQAPNEDGYEIERSLDGCKTFSLIGTQQANKTSFRDKELREHSLCYYRVRSFNSAGKSEYSQPLMATGNRNADKKKGAEAPPVKRLGE